MNSNSLEDLQALDYPVKIEYDKEDGLFVAEFLDLPGCSAAGSTVAEAYETAQQAKAEWLRVTLEQGLPVPKPSKTRDFSGRILVRLPVSLHATLVDRARINGSSLNQYIVHLLSAGAVGHQISSQLETVTGHLQEMVSRLDAGFHRQLGGISRLTDHPSEILGWQMPHQTLAARSSSPTSAHGVARLI